MIGPPQPGDLLVLCAPQDIATAPPGWTVVGSYMWKIADGTEPDDQYLPADTLDEDV